MSRGPRAPRTRSGPAANGDTPTIVAVLLACAAVVAAIIGARAAVVGDDGSDTWHSAVREDVKRDAGLVEDVRFVYSEEAPLAFQVSEGEVRADEAHEQAKGTSGLTRELLEAHAGAFEGVVRVIGGASKLAKDEDYHLDNGGYNVLQRLVDTRAENPDLVALDPDATEAEGADLSYESALMVATTLPAGLAFLCGALAHGFPSRRRWLVPLGFVLTGLSFVLFVIVEVSH
jgi:hypothetical protein